jgi:hypothetical protein
MSVWDWKPHKGQIPGTAFGPPTSCRTGASSATIGYLSHISLSVRRPFQKPRSTSISAILTLRS